MGLYVIQSEEYMRKINEFHLEISFIKQKLPYSSSLNLGFLERIDFDDIYIRMIWLKRLCSSICKESKHNKQKVE